MKILVKFLSCLQLEKKDILSKINYCNRNFLQKKRKTSEPANEEPMEQNENAEAPASEKKKKKKKRASAADEEEE